MYRWRWIDLQPRTSKWLMPSSSFACLKQCSIDQRLGRGAVVQIDEWLATARNYARYSNEGGQFDELAAFLKAAKKW